MQKRALLLTAALLTLALAPMAQAAEKGADPAGILHNPRALARYLKLTAAQVEQQKALVETLRKTVEPLRTAERPLGEQLKAALGAAHPEACNVGGLVVQLDSLHDQIVAAYQTFDTAFAAILTPEQLAKYNALKALVDEFGPGH